jgi:seryl-tRNA synthetase
LIDIEIIRQNPDILREALKLRGEDFSVVDDLMSMDSSRKELARQVEELRAHRNRVSKEVGAFKSKGTDPQQVSDIDGIRSEMREMGESIKGLDQQLNEIEIRLRASLMTVPNIPLDSVPVGNDESSNLLVRSWGELPEFEFLPKPHWELAHELGIIDFERGAKLAGSRFFALRGAGARLERALVNWMLDVHLSEHGYTEWAIPYLVKADVMEGSGNLPKFIDNLYHDVEDDLWLIPTAEVPLTGIHRDEIIPAGALPLSYVAFAPSFRREKAAAGKDTRGIKRVHQFDKVELYKVVEPEESVNALEELLAHAEKICELLQIPYRVIEICTGDLGFQSAKTYDIEMWAPGVSEWLEVSSCSNCWDFQSRRSMIRYRPSAAERPQYPHTLNGSGLAVPRVLIAIIENYQQVDGSFRVPEVLVPYMKMDYVVKQTFF